MNYEQGRGNPPMLSSEKCFQFDVFLFYCRINSQNEAAKKGLERLEKQMKVPFCCCSFFNNLFDNLQPSNYFTSPSLPLLQDDNTISVDSFPHI